MVYNFDKANANAPSTRKIQYFEMISNRGIYHEGWYANTMDAEATPVVIPARAGTQPRFALSRE